MSKRIKQISKNYMFFALAFLLLILHFSLGCSVRKTSQGPSLVSSEPKKDSPEMEPTLTNISSEYKFSSNCEGATQWNQFWCTLHWIPQEGQFVVNGKNIEAIGGEFQILAEGGQEFSISDLNGNKLYMFKSPLDLKIQEDLTIEQFQKLTNTGFPIHQLYLAGPLSIKTNGADLQLKVSQLVIENQVRIQNFNKDTKALKSGRNAGYVKIEAETILGNSLYIDTNGENGGEGEDGSDLSQSTADNGLNGGFCYIEKPVKLEGRSSTTNLSRCKCSTNVPPNNQAISLTRYISPSLLPTDGKNGRIGGSGLPGYNGGNAGLVIIKTDNSDLDSLEIVSQGGRGGQGGHGGRGEKGGKKGQLDSLSECTPENYRWPLDGVDGARGPNGTQGENGYSQFSELKGITSNANRKPY